MGALHGFFKYIRSDATKHIAKVGTFTLAVTVVSYWISFQDRAASRQESAWTTLRAAIVWTQGDSYHWGNVGQLAAMELGSLKGPGANFSHSNFACTNLAKADLRKATLDGADFRGAYLGGADFRGASMKENVGFKIANVSWIQFDAATAIDPKQLKCACVDQDKGDDGVLYRQIQNSLPANISEMLKKVNICPAARNTCDSSVQDNWKCIE